MGHGLMRDEHQGIESAIRLTVKDGSILQTLTVEGDKVFIGRLPSNSVMLDHSSVSRKHCLLRRTADGGLELLDLNSRHGTMKNGKSVERASLAAGDEIRVGEVSVTVEHLSGAPNRVHGGEYTLAPAEDEPVLPAAGSAGRKAPVIGPARESKELVSDAHRITFSELLFRQSRHAPAWAASLFVHVVMVYAFLMVPFQPAPSGTPFARVDGKIGDDLGSMLDDDVLDPDRMLKDIMRELEELPTPTIAEQDMTPVDTPQDLDDMPEFLPEMGPSAASFTSRLNAKDLSTAVGVPEMEFGKEGASGANEKAVDLLRRSLSGRGSDSMAVLRELKQHELLVVKGQYDHGEDLLDMLEMKYQFTEIRGLDRTSFAGRKVVFFNCTNLSPTPEAVKKIEQFVRRGGYLISSDWAVSTLLERAFPGYIEPLMKAGRKVLTPDEVIRISQSPSAGRHFLLTGMAIGRNEAKWWLEESSYPFRVLKEEEVEVLIESDDLDREYGTRPVAVTFCYGKGRVLHMMGHFFQEEGNLKGTFSAQRLVANFLIAAVRGK
jgi:pSer/pThr/pTyr-binding forkhead associated (FHA) protein